MLQSHNCLTHNIVWHNCTVFNAKVDQVILQLFIHDFAFFKDDKIEQTHFAAA